MKKDRTRQQKIIEICSCCGPNKCHFTENNGRYVNDYKNDFDNFKKDDSPCWGKTNTLKEVIEIAVPEYLGKEVMFKRAPRNIFTVINYDDVKKEYTLKRGDRRFKAVGKHLILKGNFKETFNDLAKK